MKKNLTTRIGRTTLLTVVPTLLLQLGGLSSAAAETESDRERRMRSEKVDKVITTSQMYKWLPEPGRQRVGPMKPAWCELTNHWKGKIAGKYMRRKLGQVKRYGMHGQNLLDIAAALCARPNQPTWQQQTGYVVQKYVNETGLPTKDAIAAIRARMAQAAWKRDQRAFCRTLAVSPEASPKQKLLARARSSLYGCGSPHAFWQSRGNAPSGLFWQLDTGATIRSEAMKSFSVLVCLSRSEKAREKAPHVLAPYALCGIDARSLSRANLERELAGSSHNSYSRTIARETFGSALAAAYRYKSVLDAMAKTDPAIKKIFFTAPRAGWSSWVATYRTNKPMFDAALAFDEKLHGPSRRALAGCRRQLRGHLGTYIKRQNVRGKKQLYEILSDNVSGVLLSALVPCTGLEGNQWEGYMLSRLLRKVRSAGGPRAAALYSVIDAVVEIRKDRSRFPFTPRTFGRVDEPDRENTQRKLWASRKLRGSFIVTKGKGTVKSVKKTAHGLLLTFKPTRVKENVDKCKRGAFWKIDRDGKVLYHRICTRIGTQWVNTTAKPITIPVDASAGVRRGSYVKFIADMAYGNAKVLRRGYPVVVYKSKSQKRLVAGFGFAL